MGRLLRDHPGTQSSNHLHAWDLPTYHQDGWTSLSIIFEESAKDYISNFWSMKRWLPQIAMRKPYINPGEYPRIHY